MSDPSNFHEATVASENPPQSPPVATTEPSNDDAQSSTANTRANIQAVWDKIMEMQKNNTEEWQRERDEFLSEL